MRRYGLQLISDTPRQCCMMPVQRGILNSAGAQFPPLRSTRRLYGCTCVILRPGRDDERLSEALALQSELLSHPALEVQPFDKSRAEGFLHYRLIPLLGSAIGELLPLNALADDWRAAAWSKFRILAFRWSAVTKRQTSARQFKRRDANARNGLGRVRLRPRWPRAECAWPAAGAVSASRPRPAGPCDPR